jgi:hypothetical protein
MTSRLERAAELERSVPAAAEMLRFYRRVVEFQEAAAREVEPLLRLATRYAPAALAQAAEELLRDPAQWPTLLHRDQPDPARSFFAVVLLRPAAARRPRRPSS